MKMKPAERRALHTKLAKKPGLAEKADSAVAEYQKLKEAGGLRRPSAAGRNRRTG